jgi:hypothetical protein
VASVALLSILELAVAANRANLAILGTARIRGAVFFAEIAFFAVLNLSVATLGNRLLAFG